MIGDPWGVLRVCYLGLIVADLAKEQTVLPRSHKMLRP